ncbi:MAG: ASKHA domain-containing protein [Spirochaetaceae bacterium]|jgi:uncharacterized 2Fe-2S/4Fe-4S cluster protein (DUF4445 family)|nr:ASKHA domain-containing protein [Spirochaetaceae bacterium]
MKIHIAGRETVCEARAEESLLEALAGAGIAISAPCGGRGICGKCRVRLLEGTVRKVAPDSSGIFLACQGIPAGDIHIELLSGEGPVINEVSALNVPGFIPEQIPSHAGLALDIGTTTLSAALVDLDTARFLETYSILNDQRIFGADVMNRIGAAKNGKTTELFNLVNRQTEGILRYFIGKWGLPKIESLSVSGNTTMLHLFTNTDPSGMGEVPFTPVFIDKKEIPGDELSLSVERVTLLPSISAFIGSDIVAGLAAIDILRANNNSLMIDIGTNGEMALFHDGRIYCCSTAAGPAFEGAEISCGTGSVPGAINKIELSEGKVSFTTIGNVPPLGICGCGLVDAIALMRSAGVIDETGALSDDYPEGYTITEGISIVNRDIRQYQLAKSAIMSGIRILCKNAGIDAVEVHRVFIAGGLGFFIDKQNAVTAGLLPPSFLDRIDSCGNLSLKGAVHGLTKPEFLADCKKITEMSTVIELAADPAFMDEFAGNMLF